MRILVYGVFAVELLQMIVLAKVGFGELATDFGKFAVLDEIGLLWVIMPILSSTGVFLSSYFRLLTSNLHSGICGPTLLRI